MGTAKPAVPKPSVMPCANTTPPGCAKLGPQSRHPVAPANYRRNRSRLVPHSPRFSIDLPCVSFGAGLAETLTMKLEFDGDILRVCAVRQLGAANANAFRDWVREAMEAPYHTIEVDLSQTTFLDSCGLGALVALHKTACSRQGKLRLLNPQPQVQQLLDLTRLSHIFDVVRNGRQPAQSEVTDPSDGRQNPKEL